MRHEIPQPNKKFTLVIRDAHDLKAVKIATKVQELSGQKISVAYVIDHLLGDADMNETAHEITQRLGGSK